MASPILAIFSLLALTTIIKANQCGQTLQRSGIEGKIAGGFDANHNEFPWIVAVFEKDTVATDEVFKFSGTVISRKVILTTAHKAQDIAEVSQLYVRAGTKSIAALSYNERLDDVQVQSVVIHENFVRKTHVNNVALLILASPFQYGINIQPICLPPDNFEFENWQGDSIIAGWGKDQNDDVASVKSELKKAHVNIVEHDVCQRQLGDAKSNSDFVLHESFVCAIGSNGEDACKGDGGSPLMFKPKGEERYIQLGITSWGIGCNRAEVPGVYVYVTKYVEWINGQLSIHDPATSNLTNDENVELDERNIKS